MIEETVVAESQPAAVPVMEIERGPLVNMTSEQRTEFRKTGTMPSSEEAAASTEPKPNEGEAKPAGDSEPPKAQERTTPKAKPSAEDRIAQLEATIEKIREGAGLKKSEAESTPAKPEPKQAPVEPPPTRPKPTGEDKKDDGTAKYETYEDFVEDLSDWKAEQREAKNQRVRQQEEQANAFKAKLDGARDRYPNFDAARESFVSEIADPAINPVVRAMLDDSDVLPDLAFTIASSKEDLASFVKMAKENPGKALRYIALTESLIAEELAGKPAEEPPVKPKTQAPRPPSEAGGRAATPPDSLEAAAKAGDFRSYRDEANRRALAKLKG